MLRLSERLSGDYTITAQAHDAQGQVAPITAVGDATVYDAPGVAVHAAAPSIVDGAMVLAVPAALLAIGRYRVVWNGTVDGQENLFATFFEIIQAATQVPAELVAEVKVALRVSNEAYDGEVEGLIAAAIDDMIASGVSRLAFTGMPDPLVKRAIIVYCRAGFGLDNPESEKLMESFRSLETHLALSFEYRADA